MEMTAQKKKNSTMSATCLQIFNMYGATSYNYKLKITYII